MKINSQKYIVSSKKNNINIDKKINQTILKSCLKNLNLQNQLPSINREILNVK
jgi:hypothetical protein